MKTNLTKLLKEAEKMARIEKGKRTKYVVNILISLTIIVSAVLFIINSYQSVWNYSSSSSLYPTICIILIVVKVMISDKKFEKEASKEEIDAALRELLKSKHSELNEAEKSSKSRLDTLRSDLELEEEAYKSKINDLHDFQLLAIGIERDYLK